MEKGCSDFSCMTYRIFKAITSSTSSPFNWHQMDVEAKRPVEICRSFLTQTHVGSDSLTSTRSLQTPMRCSFWQGPSKFQDPSGPFRHAGLLGQCSP